MYMAWQLGSSNLVSQLLAPISVYLPTKLSIYSWTILWVSLIPAQSGIETYASLCSGHLPYGTPYSQGQNPE